LDQGGIWSGRRGRIWIRYNGEAASASA
jgi:hypothetical protein